MTDILDEPISEPRADKPKFLTHTHFDELNLPEPVLKGLTEAGFTQCTPIQAQTLPLSLSGKDVAGQAQTGTGKTAAFLVTVFTRLLTEETRVPGEPAALIVSPTRELALQTYEEACLIGKYTGLSIAQVVGGVDYQKQADILRSGVDIVICTPGRIIDYFKQGIFKTGGVKIIVIDEADRLLDLGFSKDMRFILQKLPRYDKRQSLLFSATLSFRVMELTYEYMNLPEFISVTPEDVAVDGIEQSLFHVGSDQKLSLLLGLLERETWERILIFVNTKSGVEWLSAKLKGNGWPAEGITGDLPQQKRFKLMEQFKEGKIKMLIATDVASRGIHVEDISHVINFDLPQDPENYVHRIGRTARAGKTGKSMSFACETYVFHLEPLEALLNAKIPVVWPEEDWFKEDKAGPVPRTRYSQDKARKPERKPRAAAPKRGERSDRPDRNGRGDRRKEMPAFKFTIPRGENYFPGTFFGFAPQPPEGFDFSASSAEPLENDDIMDFEETSPSEVSETLPVPIKESEPDDSRKLPEVLPAEPSEPSPVKKKRRRRRYNKKKSPATASETSVSSETNNSESA
ncbi:MAG: DEAD/DEAH box helicase [Deltaproteobacteria bacterium]|nr:DEAD/DEAH box helicase [Deltaproteobacteria bacterium]